MSGGGIPVQPPGWVAPRGYSNGMRARGELLAIAGQIAWDEKARLVPGGFAAQFEQALGNVAAVVRAAGGTPEAIISLTVFVTDRTEYVGELKAVGEAYRRVLGKHFPAMALVQVAGLLEVGAKVEIQGLAVLPRPDEE
jgi:enamine deaminase RidA (YjgF/YER057c/UK114 family)